MLTNKKGKVEELLRALCHVLLEGKASIPSEGVPVST